MAGWLSLATGPITLTLESTFGYFVDDCLIKWLIEWLTDCIVLVNFISPLTEQTIQGHDLFIHSIWLLDWLLIDWMIDFRLAVGTSHGFGVIDYNQMAAITFKCTLSLSGKIGS